MNTLLGILVATAALAPIKTASAQETWVPMTPFEEMRMALGGFRPGGSAAFTVGVDGRGQAKPGPFIEELRRRFQEVDGWLLPKPEELLGRWSCRLFAADTGNVEDSEYVFTAFDGILVLERKDPAGVVRFHFVTTPKGFAHQDKWGAAWLRIPRGSTGRNDSAIFELAEWKSGQGAFPESTIDASMRARAYGVCVRRPKV